MPGRGVTSSIINAITSSSSSSSTCCGGGGGSRRVSIDSILQNLTTKKKRNSSITASSSSLRSDKDSTSSSSSSSSDNSSTMLKRKRVRFVDDDEKLTTATTTTTTNEQRIPRKKKNKLHNNNNNNTQPEDREKGTTGEFTPNSSCLLTLKGAVPSSGTTAHPRKHKSSTSSSSSTTTMTSVVQVTNIPDGANKSGVEMLIETTAATTTSRRGGVSKIEVRDGVATIALATAATTTTTDQAQAQQVEARARQMAQNLDGQWWGGRCVKARVVYVPFPAATADAADAVVAANVVDHHHAAAGNDSTSTTTSSSSTPGRLWTQQYEHNQDHDDDHDHRHHRGHDDDGGYGRHVVCDDDDSNDGSNKEGSTQTAREQQSCYEQQQQQQASHRQCYQKQQQQEQEQRVTSSKMNVDDGYSYYGHGYLDNSGKDDCRYGHHGYEDNGGAVPDYQQQQQQHLQQHHPHNQYPQAVNRSTRCRISGRKKWISRNERTIEIHGIVKAPHLEAVIPSHLEGFEETKEDVSSHLQQYCSRNGLQVQVDAALVWINKKWTATARSRGLNHNVYSGLFQFRDEVQMEHALSSLRDGITYYGNKLIVTRSHPQQQQPSCDSKYGPAAVVAAAAATTSTTGKEAFHEAGDHGQLLLRTEGKNTKDSPVSSNYQDRAAVYVTYVDRTCHIDDLSSFLAHSLIMDGVACHPDILHSFFHGIYRNLQTAYVEFDNFEHVNTLEDMGRRGALKFMGRTLRVSRWQRILPPSIKHTFRSYYLPHLRRPSHDSERNSDVRGSPVRQVQKTTQVTETSSGQNDGTSSIVGHTSHCTDLEQGTENPKNHFADSFQPEPSSTESVSPPNDPKDPVDHSGMNSETAEARTEPNNSMSAKGESQWGDIEPAANSIVNMEQLVEKQLQEIIELRLRVEILSDERNENLTSLQENVEVLTGQLSGIQQRHNQAVQSLMALTVANREEKKELKMAIEKKRRQRLLKEQEL